MNVADLNSDEKKELDHFANLYSYRHTKHSAAFFSFGHDIVFVSKGNQAGGTGLIAFGYVYRILGWHPIPEKNVVYFECPKAIEYKEKQRAGEETEGISKGLVWSPKYYYKNMHGKKCPCCDGNIEKHERLYKVYRFASQNLPESKTPKPGQTKIESSQEVKNTQYPEFTHWLPDFLLKRDITAREPVQYIYDLYGGKDITIEYVSYNQQTQSVAGHKRTGLWLDELAPEKFYDEQPARLMLEDGDINISYTPTVDNSISYYFDRIYERAQVFYRTKAWRDHYKKRFDISYPEIEKAESKESIAVVQMATDDNPLLSTDVINKKYAALGEDDPQIIDMRRYGIFAAVTGKIYKKFSSRIHVIDPGRYEEIRHGCPYFWRFYRSEDYHQSDPLAFIFVSMSPQNEVFCWGELEIDPEQYNTEQVCDQVAEMSGKEIKYIMNVVDPLAATKQSNTGRSVVQDMNRYFKYLKNDEICTGGCWESANTRTVTSKSIHNIRGREQIKLRLHNSILCKEPFNNRVIKNGVARYLPTIWFFKDCTKMIASIKKWRREGGKETKKWSHFCTALEFLAKDVRFTPGVLVKKDKKPIKQNSYFNSGYRYGKGKERNRRQVGGFYSRTRV